MPNTDYTSIINATIALTNPFRYRGYYYDTETDLYYLNSRYYDPEIGRFINADDISVLDITNVALNGLNLYAYCLNNPVNEVDENGYFIWFLVAVLAFAIIGAATSYISQGLSNGWNNINWSRVGFAALTGALGGALIASGVGAGLMAVLGGGLGFVSEFGDQILVGKNISETDWFNILISIALGAITGLFGKTGAMNTKVMESALAKSTLYSKAVNSLARVESKIATNSYRTAVGAKIAWSRVSNYLAKVSAQIFKDSYLKNILWSVFGKFLSGIGKIIKYGV